MGDLCKYCKPADPERPSIEDCVKVIADVMGEPVHAVAAGLLAQSRELGMTAEEIVHRQYDEAMIRKAATAG